MAKYAGKYETAEDLAKGYEELQAKLGEQGKELNATKREAGQLKEWVDQAAPVYQWYAANEGRVKELWTAAERGPAQPAQPAQPVVQQAAAAVNNMQGSEWLTPQERQALINETSQHIAAATLKPWTENFARAAQEYAQNQVAQMQAQQRASTNVFWQTLQRVIPPDKLAEAQKFHEESLKYADPRNLDPMKMAEESLALRGEVGSWKQKYEDMVKGQEERERADTPSFGTGSFPAITSEAKPAPQSKDDRFKAVMETTKAEHGVDGMHSLFGPNR